MHALAIGASGPTSVAMSSGAPICTASAFAFRLREEGVLDAALDDEARAGDAALPGGGEDAGDLRVGGALEIGVGEDDEGRLAAELQRGAGEVLGRVAHHLPAAASGPPVKATWATFGVARQRAPQVGAEAGDDVDDAGWEAGLVDQTGELEQRCRGRPPRP